MSRGLVGHSARLSPPRFEIGAPPEPTAAHLAGELLAELVEQPTLAFGDTAVGLGLWIAGLVLQASGRFAAAWAAKHDAQLRAKLGEIGLPGLPA